MFHSSLFYAFVKRGKVSMSTGTFERTKKDLKFMALEVNGLKELKIRRKQKGLAISVTISSLLRL